MKLPAPIRRLIDSLAPRSCQICSASGLPPGTVFCRRCRSDFSPISSAVKWCPLCGEPMPGTFYSERCMICRLSPLGLNQLRSLYRYEGAAELAIKSLKYGRHWLVAGEFGRDIAAGICSARIGDLSSLLLFPFSENHWDLIAAVPSSIQTLRSRGFSQTHLIAKALGRELRLPVAFDLLLSRNGRPAQAGLTTAGRYRNAQGAFRSATGRPLKQRILLIDDIVTSGTSLEACSRALKRAGAARVDAITVARSPNFRKHRLRLARLRAGTMQFA